MDLNTIISVTISAASPALTKVGFGEPAIYGSVPTSIIPASERTRRYSASTGLADMVSDGFPTTGNIYRAAQAILSQSPRPQTFKVLAGRKDYEHDFDLTPDTDASGETLEVTLESGGTSRTYTQTASGGGLAAEASALAALIDNDVAGWGSAGTGDFVVTASGNNVEIRASGAGGTPNKTWYISGRTNISVKDQSADRGIAADLAAILAADSDWYELIPADAFGATELALIASTIQSATNKIASVATQDSEVLTGVGIGDTLKAADRNRTSVYYSEHSMAEYIAAASAGRFLPETPGTVARMHKSLSGVTPSTLTTSEASAAHDDYVNTYEGVAVGGVTVAEGNLFKGWSSGSSETFIDTIRLIDALVFEVQARVLSLFRGAKKVPFTDAGIGQIKGAILAAIKVFEVTDPPGLTPGSAFCNVPKEADISAIDKAARRLPNVVFGAELAGAIATVTINGTLEY